MAQRRRLPVIAARRWVQVGFLLVTVAIGVRFALWAEALIGERTPPVTRPAGVEGFLPISGLMSLRLWLAGAGIHPVHPAALAILLAILAMSAVLAKSFCSHLCPVGTLSEWLGGVGRRLMGRAWSIPRWIDVPLRGIKYFALAFFLWATWMAMDLPGVRAFLDSPYNRVVDVKMLLLFARPARVTIAIVGVLAVGSMLVRDLWCRYLCPYGALLGLIGRLAPLKVTRDPTTCIDCAKCTKACPARLPVQTLVRVASVECTSCQDCVAACPVKNCLAVRAPGAIGLRSLVRPAAAVALAVAVYVGVTTAFRLGGHWRTSVSEAEYARRLPAVEEPLYTHVGGMAAVRPPGASSALATSHTGIRSRGR
ncbi:MAG: 4Fe-4S binding protein [Acidobacteriota bacterium]